MFAPKDEELKAEARRRYGSLLDNHRQVCRAWEVAGQLDVSVDRSAVAELLFSVTVGFTAQRNLVGDVDIDARVAALRVLRGTGGPPSGAGRLGLCRVPSP